MFTGIVEDTGTVVDVRPYGQGRRMVVRTRLPLGEVKLGDSIAHDGVCLTVERIEGDTFSVIAGQETLERTTLGTWGPGRRVHLERALRFGSRLDGHLVQGHVDGVGRVVDVRQADESRILWIDVGPELARFVAEKGSLAVDGVSLTVNEVAGTRCRINVIPHTAEVTRLATLGVGDPVNLEVDVLARYVDRMLAVARGEGGGLTREKLERSGF